MSAIDDGGLAFPHRDPLGGLSEGMTLRQYAAINLRVPASGIDWLDAMIKRAQHNHFAAKAMHTAARAVADALDDGDTFKDGVTYERVIAVTAYRMADAMLVACNQSKE